VRVWATGRSEEKPKLAMQLGAERTFVTGEDLPRLVDVVFETVGAATWKHSMTNVRTGGMIVVSGATTGISQVQN
jgi:NADPH:quinone reductase-like Zn-dependent oxidoreductase